MTIEKLKSFLNLDFDTNFIVLGVNRIRSSTRNFKNDETFIDYLLRMFEGRNKKIVKIF
jgi:hypothetical protein